jgi:hypothetical protein
VIQCVYMHKHKYTSFKNSSEFNLCKLVLSADADQNQLNEYYKMEPEKREKLELLVTRQLRNRQKMIVRTLRYQAKNPQVTMFHTAKNTALKMKLKFDITKEDIIVPERCPYLGCVLTFEKGKGRVQTNACLRRLNKNEGYVRGNIEVTSSLANAMLDDASKEQLLAFAKTILTIYGSES